MERSRQRLRRIVIAPTGPRDDGDVNHSTAIDRLSDVAAELERSKLWT